MRRCPRCGGFYNGARCRQDHSNLAAEVADVPIPLLEQGAWYSIRHTAGAGEFAESYQSPVQVLGATTEMARVCVYGPTGATIRDVPISDLCDPVNPLTGGS